MPARVSSKNPRKQRKGRYNAEPHNRRKLISAHLCGESGNDLIGQYNCRSVPVVKGDMVRILRGDKEIVGKEATVIKIFTKNMMIGLDDVNVKKADGSEETRKIAPSNVMVIKLNLSDPKRKQKLERLREGQ